MFYGEGSLEWRAFKNGDDKLMSLSKIRFYANVSRLNIQC